MKKNQIYIWFITVFIVLVLAITSVYGSSYDLLVCDYFNDRALRYDGSTGTIIEEFIPKSVGFNGPKPIKYGPDGNIYIANQLNQFDLLLAMNDFVSKQSEQLTAKQKEPWIKK